MLRLEILHQFMTNKEKYEQSKHIYLCHESEFWPNREGAKEKTIST